MGIPSYFSFIIKNHPEIITDMKEMIQSGLFYRDTHEYPKNPNAAGKFDHLFFDANSLIYDAFHALMAQKDTIEKFDQSDVFFPLLTDRVITLIEKHIKFIQPKHTIFVAFDGIPPTAKIVQQRARRFKAKHMEKILQHFTAQDSPPNPWQTSMITPGTPFMEYLSERIKRHFEKRAKTTPIQILSTSQEPGEGEHKIFRYLRTEYKPTTLPSHDKIAIYGLDSDLIMLSLLSVGNIYIFREAPAFFASKLKNITNKSKSDENSRKFTHQPPPSTPEIYFLNIDKLSSHIREMCNSVSISNTNNPALDYVFMCFLLGNDFMPHIHALNIRTNGLTVLQNYYKQLNLNLVVGSEKNIQIHELHTLLVAISNQERKLLIEDNRHFSRLSKPLIPMPLFRISKTDFSNKNTTNFSTKYERKSLEEYITCFPQQYTAKRKYINPEQDGWQQRYRKIYPMAKPAQYVKQMLETWKYYLGISDKLEWYADQPPLLEDLCSFLGNPDVSNMYDVIDNAQPLVQLKFEHNSDYLDYVLSDKPLAYDFGFSQKLWEVPVSDIIFDGQSL